MNIIQRNFTKKQDLNCHLPSMCFSDRPENQDSRPGLWLAEPFLTSILQLLKGIQRNLPKSNILTSSPNCVFFSGPSEDQNGHPGLWLAEPFSTFFLQPMNRIQRNFTNKQELNVLYQECVFRTNRKTKMAALASDWLNHFWLLFCNCWKEFNETCQNQYFSVFSPVCIFSGRLENQNGHPGFWLAEPFSTFFSATDEQNSTKLYNEARSQCPPPSMCFSDRSENQDGCPGVLIGWVIFWHLFCNCWKEFIETWQEDRFQRPLPRLCFSG